MGGKTNESTSTPFCSFLIGLFLVGAHETERELTKRNVKLTKRDVKLSGDTAGGKRNTTSARSGTDGESGLARPRPRPRTRSGWHSVFTVDGAVCCIDEPENLTKNKTNETKNNEQEKNERQGARKKLLSNIFLYSIHGEREGINKTTYIRRRNELNTRSFGSSSCNSQATSPAMALSAAPCWCGADKKMAATASPLNGGSRTSDR